MPITTNFNRCNAGLISLHSVSFTPPLLSKLQSTRCPCCARLRCRSGCGCHAFCILSLLSITHPSPFNNQPHHSKNSRQPLLVRALLQPDTHAVALLVVRTAFTSFLHSGFHAHTLPPTRSLTPLLFVRLFGSHYYNNFGSIKLRNGFYKLISNNYYIVVRQY